MGNSLAFRMTLLGLLGAVVSGFVWIGSAVAKKGPEEAKAEVGTNLDDRSGRGGGGGGGGNNGSGSSTSGSNGSGRSGKQQGYDREGVNGGTSGNGTGVQDVSGQQGATTVINARRDELDRF